MPERPADARDRDELRRRAEAAAVAPGGVLPEALPSDEVERALHELRVHQIELEMQNDELRRAQVELETARARCFDLYDRAPVGYVTFDEDGVIGEANLAASTLLGMPPGKLIGRPVTEFVAREARDAFYLLRRRLFTGRLPQVCELPMTTEDGTAIWVLITAALVVNASGMPAGRAGLTDITPAKAAEQEIRSLNETLEARVAERTTKLEATNRELETFNYSASHDLRAPLRSINGYASLLERRLGDTLDADSRHYLDSIKTASLRLGMLIDELLDYSRLGRDSIRAEPMPLGPLLEGLRPTFAARIAEAGGTLVLAEPAAVPLADPHLTERILANLLDNALTYRRPDVPPLVTISSVRHGASVTVSIADNGIGIPSQHQAKIFGVFTRLHAEDEYPGTGIGLAIVRKAARLMGSEVTVASVEGEGSTFSLELPAAAPKAET